MVKEIPSKKLYETLLVIYNKKEKANLTKLRLFFDVVLDNFNEDEKNGFLQLVSNDLKYTTSDATIRSIIKILPNYWEYYDKSARLRIENKLIKSVLEGYYNEKNGKCVKGALGTWVTNISKKMLLKSEMDDAITTKLYSSVYEEQAYIFEYFNSEYICNRSILDNDPFRMAVINECLEKGDIRFYNCVNYNFPNEKQPIPNDLKESFNNFKEVERVIEEETLPF